MQVANSIETMNRSKELLFHCISGSTERTQTSDRSPFITRAIKSRKTSWADHVARTRQIRNAYNILVGKRERKRDHLEDPGIDGKII
jgi:hypothetical protein